VAGLLAIAVFGVVLSKTFDTRVRSRLALAPPVIAAIERELSRFARVDLERVPALDPARRAAARRAIDELFVSAFRRVMIGAAILALLADAALVRTPPAASTDNDRKPKVALKRR
jgi:hypothetical protein